LFYSNSNRRNAIFYEALQRLQQQFPEQLHIEWLFSNNADLKKARLSTYNLQELLNANLKYNPANALMLTCGPYYYMKMVEITWLTAGFVRNAFRKEIYDPENIIPASKRYYDKEDRLVTIRFNGNNHAVTVKWNETILDAALRHQIALPYNCKAGRCSACVCQLVSGKVWMHYNEVLTHEDEQRGLVLTCTGHPATEGVVISV
jgi:ring-1,2-phenylacetyl-CoA epoxidase subunit PaaE